MIVRVLKTRQLSLFFKSNQADPAPFAALQAIGRGAQLVNCVLHDYRVDSRNVQTDNQMDNSVISQNHQTQVYQTQQIQTLSRLTVINTAFLCLGFFTSVYCLPPTMSIFWQETLSVFRHEQHKGIQRPSYIPTGFLGDHQPNMCRSGTTNSNIYHLGTWESKGIQKGCQREIEGVCGEKNGRYQEPVAKI